MIGPQQASPGGHRVELGPRAARRLLVVDDERIQRLIVARAVESVGFIVDGAADLDEAAAWLSKSGRSESGAISARVFASADRCRPRRSGRGSMRIRLR
jgi:hypothetical protein